MADDLLTLCQEATDAIGVESPSAIIGSSNETARRLRAAAIAEAEELVRYPEKPWTALIRVHEFTTTATVDEYALPSDFKYVLNDTLWDRSNYWEMRGPLNPQQWQRVKSSVLASSATTRRRFRFVSDGAATNPTTKLVIDPVPATTGETLVYEYITNGYCKDASTGAPKAKWAADTDVFLLDPHLFRLGIIWRFLSRQGLPYEEEFDTWEKAVEAAIARDGGAPILNLVPMPRNGFITTDNIPDTGFGS